MSTVSNIVYIGRMHKFCKYDDKTTQSEVALNYLERIGYNVEKLSHRMVKANVDAGYLSLAKYGRPQPNINPFYKKCATKMLAQCVKGIGDSRVDHNFENLTRLCTASSSPGFPWNSRYTKKKDLFKDHSYQSYWEWWHKMRMQGYRLPVVFSNAVKSELVSLEKILKNAVRTYTAGPVQITMEGYCYFSDQNQKLIQEANALHTPILSGYQKFALGWHKLYNQLNRFPNAGMMDISSYDSGCFLEAFQEVYRIRKSNIRADHLTEEVSRGIDQYLLDIVNTYILCDGGEIVQKTTGNPSGQFNTISDNSMILTWAWFYAYVVLKPVEYNSSWYDFKENIELYVCGDDSIYTVSDEIRDWFYPAAIQEIFQNHFGWKFKIETPCFMKLDETEFCSMSWSKNGHRIFPAPSTSKVLSSLVYKRKHESLRMDFLRGCALRIESWYSKELRGILNGYLQYMMDNFYHEMVALPITESDPFSFEDVQSSYLSAYEIENIYIGGENHNVSLQPIEFVVSASSSEYPILNGLLTQISSFDE